MVNCEILRKNVFIKCIVKRFRFFVLFHFHLFYCSSYLYSIKIIRINQKTSSSLNNFVKTIVSCFGFSSFLFLCGSHSSNRSSIHVFLSRRRRTCSAPLVYKSLLLVSVDVDMVRVVVIIMVIVLVVECP